MKTDDLVKLLAAGVAPVPAGAVGRRFGVAMGWGVSGAVLLMLVTLGLRSDLAPAAGELMFWIKPGFAACLALATPLLVLWLVAAVVLANAAPAQRDDLIFGTTWKECPVNIAFISLPVFAATLWAMKGLAPTRLALAGASAGLLAGALSALVYALHCPESAVPFLGVWYVLGIAIPTLAGAVLGPRVLRW